MARKVVAPPEKQKKHSKVVEAVSTSLDDIEALNAHKKAREDQRNEKMSEDLLYGKDAYKRTVRDTIEERDRRGARLHNLGGGKRITIEWDLNKDAIRDQIFKLTIGDQTAYLSAVEIQKYLRWV